MKIAVIIVRILMGLLYLFSAVVVLFKLVPIPELTGDVKVFNQALSFYLLPIVKIIELICAVALISGFFAPLANVVIFPITVNIFLYHLYMGPEGLPAAIFLLLANLFLAYAYRKHYEGIFATKASL